MIQIKGVVLKRLIRDISKFPFGAVGDEIKMVTLEGSGDGYLWVRSIGLVVGHARGRCEGSIEQPVGVDARVLENFASALSDKIVVTIRLENSIVVFKGKGEGVATAALKPKAFEKIVLPETKLEINKVMAKRISYLSDIAFSDASRAELCCVMLSGKRALAVNQKTSASLRGPVTEHIPVPLLLAKVLSEGDVLYVGPKLLVLKSSEATYSMPSLSVAVKKYPVELMSNLLKMPKIVVARVDGARFASKIQRCNSIIGSLSKVEVVVEVRVTDGFVGIFGKNAGSSYSGVLKATGTCDQVLHAPLADMVRAISFLDGPVTLSVSEHGEFFIQLKEGFIVFPAFIAPKTKRKK